MADQPTTTTDEPTADDTAPDDTTSPPVAPGDDGPDTFDREYVQQLRAEAADHRRARRDAEDQLEELRGTVASLVADREQRLVADTLTGVMADPADLAAFVDLDELRDDDGQLDPERIRGAGRDLVKQRPHLGPRVGGADQGRRPSVAPPSSASPLADRLRDAAGG